MLAAYYGKTRLPFTDPENTGEIYKVTSTNSEDTLTRPSWQAIEALRTTVLPSPTAVGFLV